jgi:hypothetical protein
MPILDALISPIAALIDKIIPDPRARNAAKLELLKLQGSQEMDAIKTQVLSLCHVCNDPVGDPDGPDRRCPARDGAWNCRRDERLSGGYS